MFLRKKKTPFFFKVARYDQELRTLMDQNNTLSAQVMGLRKQNLKLTNRLQDHHLGLFVTHSI